MNFDSEFGWIYQMAFPPVTKETFSEATFHIPVPRPPVKVLWAPKNINGTNDFAFSLKEDHPPGGQTII